MDEEIRGYHESGVERDRLQQGPSRLAFARTKEFPERWLPPVAVQLARAVEPEPTVIGASPHLLAIAVAP